MILKFEGRVILAVCFLPRSLHLGAAINSIRISRFWRAGDHLFDTGEDVGISELNAKWGGEFQVKGLEGRGG